MFREYTRGVDAVMRYESIKHDLDLVFRKLGISTEVAIPDINRTNERTQRDYRAFYSRSSAFAVKIAFCSDLKYYGYKFDDVDQKNGFTVQ